MAKIYCRVGDGCQYYDFKGSGPVPGETIEVKVINEKLFPFFRHYAEPANFNNALSNGMKQVRERIGANKKFTFYSARHSRATIGKSKEVNIDKHNISEGLNYVEEDTKTTDGYINKDYSLIWECKNIGTV